MHWKNILIIIGVYLIIFGSIFYLLLPNPEENSEEITAREIFVDLFKDVRDRLTLRNLANPFDAIRRIEISKHILPTSCIFRRNFDCVFFKPDKIANTLTFQFQNTLGKTVTIMNVEARGDISCIEEVNKQVRNLDEFYVRLSNCTFAGKDSRLIIRYHEGSPQFSRPAEGRIIVK